MKRVVITGLGVISPVGNDVQTFWQNLLAGVCGIDFIREFPTDELPVKIAGLVKDFDPLAYGMDKAFARKQDRFALYGVAAAAQAVADAGLTAEGEGANIGPDRFGVYVGSGIGGFETQYREAMKMAEDPSGHWVSPLLIPTMISNIAGGNVAITYNAQGPNIPVVTACATGTHSVGEAYRLIREGRADAVITGGTEAAICEMAIGGFNNMKALTQAEDPMAASLPFDARRKGFVLGEGCGILVLESETLAKRRGAKIYAEVCGYGNTCDAHHYTAPHPEGRGAAQAMTLALQEAGFQDNEHLYINAHGTGTPLNDKGETKAIKTTLGEEGARKAVISSTKSMHGHMLGATGAVELIISALALQNGIIPPTIHLDQPDPECDLDYTPHTARKWQADIAISNTFGFGGNNASVALRKI